MENIDIIFSTKFKNASLIYLTINDENELRKQLKDMFDDVWYLDYCYDFAIINLDKIYLENKLNGRIKNLLNDYPNRICDFNNILDFIICIVNKVKTIDEFIFIEDIYIENENIDLLSAVESYRLKRLSDSNFFQPLLKALDLPYLGNDNQMIFNTNFFFAQDLLDMINQHAVYRIQSNFLSSQSY